MSCRAKEKKVLAGKNDAGRKKVRSPRQSPGRLFREKGAWSLGVVDMGRWASGEESQRRRRKL
jgi:hypothetical protein